MHTQEETDKGDEKDEGEEGTDGIEEEGGGVKKKEKPVESKLDKRLQVGVADYNIIIQKSLQYYDVKLKSCDI